MERKRTSAREQKWKIGKEINKNAKSEKKKMDIMNKNLWIFDP